MRVIIKEVGKLPQIQNIENTLEVLKELVGGYIEVVRMSDDILMICNEEGKLQGLPPNFSTGYDVIVGTVVFVSFDGEEDFTDLNDWQVEYILGKFA